MSEKEFFDDEYYRIRGDDDSMESINLLEDKEKEDPGGFKETTEGKFFTQDTNKGLGRFMFKPPVLKPSTVWLKHICDPEMLDTEDNDENTRKREHDHENDSNADTEPIDAEVEIDLDKYEGARDMGWLDNTLKRDDGVQNKIQIVDKDFWEENKNNDDRPNTPAFTEIDFPQLEKNTQQKDEEIEKPKKEKFTIDDLADLFAAAKAHSTGEIDDKNAHDASKLLISLLEDPVKIEAEKVEKLKKQIPPLRETGTIPKAAMGKQPQKHKHKMHYADAVKSKQAEAKRQDTPTPTRPNWEFFDFARKQKRDQEEFERKQYEEKQREELKARKQHQYEFENQQKQDQREYQKRQNDRRREQERFKEQQKAEYEFWRKQKSQKQREWTQAKQNATHISAPIDEKTQSKMKTEEKAQEKQAGPTMDEFEQLQKKMKEMEERHQAEKARFEGPSFQKHRATPAPPSDSATSQEPTSLSRTFSFREPKQVTFDEEEIKKVKEETIWHRMEMGTPQQDQIKNKEKQIKTQANALQQQDIIIDMIQKVQSTTPANNDIAELVKVAKENIMLQKQQLQHTQAEIEQSKKVATYYSPALQRPPLYEFTDMNITGTREALEAKNIRAAIEPFNPDKNTESDFGDTWRQVLLYTQNFKMDEKAFINILTILIQGSASKVLYEQTMAQKSLYNILQTLGDLYSKRRTIVDDMNDLNTFKRKPNEPIHTAMQRAKIAAERVRHLWPATIWNANKKLEILLSILRQIISPETKRHLEYEEMKYMKTGTMLEYNAMLDLVETFEMTRDQMPRTEKNLIINVCTGTPKLVEQDTIISDQVRTLKLYSGTIKGRKGEALRETLNNLDYTLKINGVEPMDMGKTIPTDLPPSVTFNKKRKIGDEGTYRNRNEKPRNTERYTKTG
jgi:hypothetical protein